MRWLLLIAAAGSMEAQILAGAAAVKITPPKGAPMAGYYFGRAATGVHDDLYAKALVFDDGSTRAAMVSCDLIHMPGALAAKAREEAARRTGIPAGNILINATHTHTGPQFPGADGRFRGEGETARIAERYTAELPLLIAASVERAVKAMAPAEVSATAGREETLAFNRRFWMSDGTVGWNPGKNNPKIVRPAGPVDHEVPLVVVRRMGGAAIAAYVNFAMHLDTAGGTDYSADFPFTLGKLLQAATTPELTAIFTMGCSGNVNHLDVHWDDRQKGHHEAARIGTVLAAEVLRSWKKAVKANAATVRVSSERVALPLAPVAGADVEWARPVAATFDQPKAAPFLDLVRAIKILDVAAREGKPFDAEVQVIALGKEIAWVGLPGEIFTELGMAIKQASPYKHTIVVSLANDHLGYIPNRKAYAEGAYEVISTRCAAGAGELLVESATRQLIRLHQE
ncbi:MAG TPA: hypothetical protein DEH78_00180 [Solibacterales bacterium]|nr:hypothetical protein [Bryobacterales bacterium]